MPPQRAHQACNACKRLKRGCDKGLPTCRPCFQAGRGCEYSSTSRPPPTASDLDILHERIIKLEEQLQKALQTPTAATAATAPGRSRIEPSALAQGRQKEVGTQFPSALFLDIDNFIWSEGRLPHPQIAIPVDVLAALTQGNTIINVCKEYFSTIHMWWPVVSKMRLNTGISVINSGPDMAMLFLSMRLIISSPVDTVRELLYGAAKSYMSELAAAGIVSHCYLQALLLVALYEYSHAIYPAAWLTIGQCARHVSLLELSSTALQPAWTRKCTTWTEIEERRRIYWGVFVLDRVSCLGSKRSPALPNIINDMILPNDDKGWDEGDVSSVTSPPATLVPDPSQSAFAHLCKAAVLAGNAIKLFSSPNLTQASTLTDDLLTFISHVDAIASSSSTSSHAHTNTSHSNLNYQNSLNTTTSNHLKWLPARSIARSALYIVLDTYSCPEKLLTMSPGIHLSGQSKSVAELEMQQRAMGVLKDTSHQARALVASLLSPEEQHDDTVAESLQSETEVKSMAAISPLCLDMAYAALATFHWLAGEEGQWAYHEEVRDLGRFLERMGVRWRAGSEYAAIAGRWNVIARAQRCG